MARHDGLRQIDDLAMRPTSLIAEHVEGGFLVDAVSLHQDPFRPLRDGSPPEGTLESVIFGESAEDEC